MRGKLPESIEEAANLLLQNKKPVVLFRRRCRHRKRHSRFSRLGRLADITLAPPFSKAMTDPLAAVRQ